MRESGRSRKPGISAYGLKREMLRAPLMLALSLLFLFCSFTPVIGANDSEEDLWQKGNAYCLQAKWKEAIDTLQDLLKKYPATRFIEAHFWIGYSNIELGRYGRGINELKDFAKKYPGNNYTPQALFKVGEVYETRLKQYDRALAVYNEIINRYPQAQTSVPAAQNQAVIYERRKKDYKQAEVALNKSKKMAVAQSMTPDNIYMTRANSRIRFINENSDYNYQPLSLFTDGLNMEEDKNWGEAANIYLKVLTKYPLSKIADDAQYHRITCLFQMKRYKETVLEGDKFLKDYPVSPYLPDVRSIMEQAKRR